MKCIRRSMLHPDLKKFEIMNMNGTKNDYSLLESLCLGADHNDELEPIVVEAKKMEEMRHQVFELTRGSETLIAQNSFLINRLNELEDNNQCLQLRKEVEALKRELAREKERYEDLMSLFRQSNTVAAAAAVAAWPPAGLANGGGVGVRMPDVSPKYSYDSKYSW